MACDAGTVNKWSSGIGLPSFVGTAFCGSFGRLPNSLDELMTWGDSSGYRHGGVWTNTPSGNPGSGQPGDKSTVGGSIGGSASGSFSVAGLEKFVERNPLVIGLGIVGAILLLRR